MTMESYIEKAIKTFYGLISGKGEGAGDTRYRSWEWCYSAFKQNKEKYKKAKTDEEKMIIVDHLSLHLGFYLASWGMYRGSSFLLQRDYKAHIKAVKYILEADCEKLWEYVPEEKCDGKKSDCNNYLFGKEGLYERIRSSYDDKTDSFMEYDLESGGALDIASDTLVTKILMGTMGCVPAFDRFLKKGISWLKEYHGYKNITQSIENDGATFEVLEEIAIKYKDYLKIDGNETLYPVMKCLDMFLWQVGFELDIKNGFKEAKCEKKTKLIRLANKIGISGNTESEIIDGINVRWGLKQE